MTANNFKTPKYDLEYLKSKTTYKPFVYYKWIHYLVAYKDFGSGQKAADELGFERSHLSHIFKNVVYALEGYNQEFFDVLYESIENPLNNPLNKTNN